MKKEIILSLDVATKTGWCVFESGKVRVFGSFGVGANTHGEKLMKFEKEIRNLLNKYNPDIVLIEDIYCVNKKTYSYLSMLRGIAIVTVFKLMKIDPVFMSASQVRKILGCGKTKRETFDWVCEKYKIDLSFNSDNDIADSIALGTAFLLSNPANQF